LHSASAISVGDVSKPLGLGGLRIGWAVSQDLHAVEAITRSVQLLSGGPSTVAMKRATAAMENYDRLLAERRAAAAANAPAVFAALDEAGWSFEPPDAGWTFLAWPPEPFSADFEGRLAAAGLLLVPGSAFGLAGGYRLSLFAPVGRLRQALYLARPEVERASRAVVVLTKAPVAGLAKTRLAATVGDEPAERLARAFLLDTLETASAVADEAIVAFTPGGSEPLLRELANGWRLCMQPEADFGTRLLAALDSALERATRAVLIGTDTPDIPASFLVEAFERLWRCDLVVGPASDGGFYLVAVKETHAGLFDGLRWSTPSVCAGLLENAHRLGLSVSVLPEWGDIDDLASLAVAAGRIAGSGRAPRTGRALERLSLEVGCGV
jgi:rSAM/selenodomain-associated transferase 1